MSLFKLTRYVYCNFVVVESNWAGPLNDLGQSPPPFLTKNDGPKSHFGTNMSFVLGAERGQPPRQIHINHAITSDQFHGPPPRKMENERAPPPPFSRLIRLNRQTVVAIYESRQIYVKFSFPFFNS